MKKNIHKINISIITICFVLISIIYIASGGEDFVLYGYIGLLPISALTSFISHLIEPVGSASYFKTLLFVFVITGINIIYGVKSNIGSDNWTAAFFIHSFYVGLVVITNILSIIAAKTLRNIFIHIRNSKFPKNMI